MTDPAMAALGLIFAESMYEEAREVEDWAWAAIPKRSIEEAALATAERMKAQDQVNRARLECGQVPEEEQ